MADTYKKTKRFAPGIFEQSAELGIFQQPAKGGVAAQTVQAFAKSGHVSGQKTNMVNDN